MIKFLLFFFFSLPCFFCQEKIDFQIEDNTADIKNKILKDMFFRGEIADSIMDKKIYKNLDIGKFSTRSELRDILIKWIYKNPDKAASIYYSLKNGLMIMPNGIVENKHSARLKDRFIDMVSELEKSAKNMNLSDERLRLDSTRVFEGFSFYGDRSIEILKNTVDDLNQKKEIFIIQNFRLNMDAINNEESDLRRFYSYIEEEHKNFNDNLVEADFKKLKSEYENFLVFLSDIKGMKVLDEEKALYLEKSRLNIRRDLAHITFLFLKLNLLKELNKIEDSKFKNKALEFISILDKKMSVIYNKDEGIKSVYLEMPDFLKEYDFIIKEISFYAYTLKLEEEIKAISFSGYYDYFLYNILSFIEPDNIYKSDREKTIVFLKEIKSVRSKIANQDFSSLFGDYANKEKMLEISATIKRLNEISISNRKMQFHLFEVFFPFSLDIIDQYDFKPYLNITRIYKFK